jgi:predicted MFS family arabinose efflux permease
LFEPQSLAFVSEHVPFEKRGTAIGILELAWALAWIIGTPLFGFFVDYGRWWMTFVVAGVAAIVSAAFVLRYSGMGSLTLKAPAGPTSRDVRAVLTHPLALRMLGYGMLISMPAQLLGLIYGPWMRETFTLTPTVLGVLSIVIGAADLLAELATIVLVDRLGKRRALLVSTALYAASIVFFWLGTSSLLMALIGLFLIFFTFEFALVTSLAVQTEILPNARTTMNGAVAASHNLSRMLASFIAVPIFAGGGLAWVALLGTLLVVLAVAVGWALGRNRDTQARPITASV